MASNVRGGVGFGGGFHQVARSNPLHADPRVADQAIARPLFGGGLLAVRQVILAQLSVGLARQVDLKDVRHRDGVWEIVIAGKLFAPFLKDLQAFHHVAACMGVSVVNVKCRRPFIGKTILGIECMDGFKIPSYPADATFFVAEMFPSVKKSTNPNKIA